MKYQIDMSATVRKQFVVEADSESAAEELAYQVFSSEEDGADEKYTETIDSITLLEE